MHNPKISVFKDLFKSTDVPYIVDLSKVFERIRVGKSKHLTDEIRKGKKELKLKLPSIVFAGEFLERNSNGLKKHSGLMVVDFDKYPDIKTMKSHLKKLKKNPHFISLFISPSGNGIKGVVRVPEDLNKETHPKYFKAFQKKFEFEYFDMANSNVDRVCFESYDPKIFINYEADIFTARIIDEGFAFVDRVAILPLDNEDIIIRKVMDFGWKKEFSEGSRNAFIFDLAGTFCEYGISETTTEGYILSNVINGDFSERETLTAIKSAYQKRIFDSKYFENYQKIERIKSDLKNGKKEVISKHNINQKTYEIIKESKEHDDFWYYDKKKVKVDALKYKWFLERNGFKKYFPNEVNKPTWVKINANKVRETSIEKIKDFVLDYLIERQEFDVWKLCVNYNTLFSEQYLLMLDSIELIMLRDKKDNSYIAFKNGILEVSGSRVKLIDYIDVDGYVWESQIIDRSFKVQNENNNDYKRFVGHVSNDDPLPMECVIGYLLSTYKNKMNNKAIILNDEVISENPEGGTGKGLLMQGLKQIRRVSILDGKSHDDKKSFPYQTVSQDTQILVFDDVKKNFSFESKFSLVTEGMTLERKNKDAIKLTVEDSPKMVISTNYAIKGEGESHNRRRHEIEITQYYGKDRTPIDEFGHQLFDDWDKDHYIRFDNYMVHCLQCYLNNGLIKQKAKNIKMRKFIAETSMEFYEWIKDVDNFPLNSRNEKQQYFQYFTDEYQDFKRWLSRKKFNIWIQKYSSFTGAEYSDGISNGSRWFEVTTKGNDKVNEDDVNNVPF